MKHAVVVAHPKSKSFVAAMARAYAAEVRGRGHLVEMRDLYAMDFDPRLKASELPGEGMCVHDDVIRERALLAAADVFVFCYPFWFNTPPAILKGYMERVFGLGFAYGPDKSGTRPLLSDRKLFLISSSGAPRGWVERTGAGDAERHLFDSHFAAVCGLKIIDHLHFGEIVPGIRPDFVESCGRQVSEVVRRHF